MEHVAETGKQHEPGHVGSHGRDASPSASSLPPALQLQQLAGNQAMQELLRSGFIHAKLAISSPDDPEEREADNVAHAIMRKPASAPCSCSADGEMCEECQQKQTQLSIQRRASASSAPAHVPRIVSDVLRSTGHPLDASTRAFFEPRFGRDFSHVRIHTDSAATESARSINAHAYTAGSDIVFASGKYSPDSTSGRSLLAHELTHSIQSIGVSEKAHAALKGRFTGDLRVFRATDPGTTAPPAVLEDLIRQTPAGFKDPLLDTAYQDYVKQNTPGYADPHTWALRQTVGAPRDRLVQLLGPDYAIGQREGLARPPVNVLAGQRPPGYLDPQLAQDMKVLAEQPRFVFDRLQNLIATPIEGGLVSQSHISILQGNIAEALALPDLYKQLQDVRIKEPDAQLFLGVRARVTLSDGKLSDPVQFTDGLIASVRGNTLYVHRIAEIKSGPEGGAEAQEQVHRWIEGHSTFGMSIILPGVEHEFAYSEKVREVINLTTAPRVLIVPQGARFSGEGSGHKVPSPTIPIELRQTPEQIAYLTRLVAQFIIQYQQAIALAKQIAANALVPAKISGYNELLDPEKIKTIQAQNNGFALLEGKLYRVTVSGSAVSIKLVDPSLVAIPQGLPALAQGGLTPAGQQPPATPALPTAVATKGAPAQTGPAPLALPAGQAQGTAGPMVIPQAPSSGVVPPNILNFTPQPIVSGERVIESSEVVNPVIGDVFVAGFNNFWVVGDVRTGAPVAGVFEGGAWYRVVSEGHAIPLDAEGRLRTEIEPIPFEHIPTGFKPLPPEASGESSAPAGASGGVKVGAGALGILLVAQQILEPIGKVLDIQRHNIAIGDANINFWTRFGGNPKFGVWDQNNRVDLDPLTAPTTSVFGSPSYRYVADLDINSLRAKLPQTIHSNAEFLLFLDLARTIDAFAEDPPMPDFPTKEERKVERRYTVWVGRGDKRHSYDITDIIHSVERQTLSDLDETMRARLRGWPASAMDNVFRLKRGSETPIFRSAGGHQPILSGRQVFGPDPWVRPTGQKSGGGLWSWFVRGHYSDRVLVEPANADAQRSASVSAYQITQSIEDTLKEVQKGGREVLKKEPEDGTLESFIAGPGPGEDSRFGVTRYYRHQEQRNWTVAIGELRQFWVNADDLDPVQRTDVEAYAKPGPNPAGQK